MAHGDGPVHHPPRTLEYSPLKKTELPFDKLRANGKDQWNRGGNPFVLSLSKDGRVFQRAAELSCVPSFSCSAWPSAGRSNERPQRGQPNASARCGTGASGVPQRHT